MILESLKHLTQLISNKISHLHYCLMKKVSKERFYSLKLRLNAENFSISTHKFITTPQTPKFIFANYRQKYTIDFKLSDTVLKILRTSHRVSIINHNTVQ